MNIDQQAAMQTTRSRGFFVTGTDTDVGKTIVTAALTAILRHVECRVLPVKPVQTGCRPASAGSARAAPDIITCLRLSGARVSPDILPLLTTYRFVPACSPHLAAARCGARISLPRIMRDFRQLQKAADFLIVEGAGGALAPLNARQTMLDMMRAMDLPVILVSRPNLGAINHVLLSIAALRNAGLKIAGLVFNNAQDCPRNYIMQDNIKFIPRRARAPMLGVLPHIPNIGAMMPDDFKRHAAVWLNSRKAQASLWLGH